MTRTRTTTVLVLALALLGLLATFADAAGLDRRFATKAGNLSLQTAAPSGRLVIKFHEDSGLVMHRAGLAGTKALHRDRFLALLRDKGVEPALRRHFEQSVEDLAQLRRTGQDKARRPLPDLNTYAHLDLTARGLHRSELLALVKELQADPAVETAFLEPVAVPAALGFDAFTGTYTPPTVEEIDEPAAPSLAQKNGRDTPNYISYQGYLNAPPSGVNALAVNDIPGARGADMRMVDVELGWRLSHEDLPATFLAAGNTSSTQDNRNHGTAVLGEIAGQDNGFGVRGIAPETQIGVSSAYYSSLSSALLTAWGALGTGDVILIELHAPGPNATGEGQEGYVPMEFWQDNFDVIQSITAAGGVIVEAAGNGGENLDDPTYGNLFDREYRDSGAIMCGAANTLGYPYSWSNNGTRVDVNGWGGQVTTCGYGDLQDTSEDEFYTRYFSGTSSASPIVTGSVVALQGMAKANYDFILDALTIRDLLASTGTPQQPGNIIGPRPDILAAYQSLEWGLGEISGTVTDAATGLPVAGVDITVTGTDYSTISDEQGAYLLTLPAGSQELHFNQFFYQEGVGNGLLAFDTPAVLDMALTPWPTVDLRAVVRTGSGSEATTARMTALGAPLTATADPAGNGLLMAGAPIGKPLQLRFDGVPGHGVDALEFTPTASPTGYNFLYPELAVSEYDFELWWYNLTAQNGDWTWGAPAVAPVAFSGVNCWGVGMEGEYDNSITDFLTSPDYYIYGHEHTYLSFHFWCDMEEGLDGVQLQIQGPNNLWETLVPVGGYPGDKIQALGNEAGWTGNSGGWQGAMFDISDYTDLPVAYRFKFASDSAVKGAGFFFDDVTFEHGDSVSPVPDEGTVPPAARAALSVHPNPFNPQTTIAWEISRPGPVSVKVFDPRGHLVRELLNEDSAVTRGSVVWDGRDEAGQSAASGTYLVQVRDGAGQRSTRSVTLLK